jgi:formyl-CoA transferase
MLALRHRDQTGEGQEIDAALYEGLFTLVGTHVIDFDQLGIVQERQGNRLPFVSPRTTFQTSDGQWIAIAGSTQSTFERIARGLGIADVIGDPRFADNRLRIRNAEALEARLAEAIAAFTLEAVLEILDESAAPGGPALDISQIFEHPHYAARENIATVADDELGAIRMQNVVPRLSRSPGSIAHAGLKPGEHNGAVYGDLLGLSEPELRELAELGVV